MASESRFLSLEENRSLEENLRNITVFYITLTNDTQHEYFHFSLMLLFALRLSSNALIGFILRTRTEVI